MTMLWDGRKGLASFTGKVRDLYYSSDSNLTELIEDLSNRQISRVEAIRSYIDNNFSLEERKELADELQEEVKVEADVKMLCRKCFTRLEVADSHYECRGIVHGASAQEEVVTSLECPRCGERRKC